MKFTARIQLRGINPYVLVSAERAGQIKPGWKRAMPVLIRINGAPDPAWQINMMPVGDGGFYLYLDASVRGASGTAVGDMVEVTIDFDDRYQGGPQHGMLPEFAAQLAEQPAARAKWDSLTPSLQKEVLRYLAGLKSDEARQRNVQRALRVLGGAKERFLARDWNL
jgi:hypothetical protein